MELLKKSQKYSEIPKVLQNMSEKWKNPHCPSILWYHIQFLPIWLKKGKEKNNFILQTTVLTKIEKSEQFS